MFETTEDLVRRLETPGYLGSKDHKDRKHYDWETLVRPAHTDRYASIEQLENLSKSIKQLYAKDMVLPKIGYTKHFDYSKGQVAASICGRNVIGFASWATPTVGIYLHEQAHLLNSFEKAKQYQPINGGHGPAFIGIVIDLYTKFAGANREYLEHQARMLKVPFDYSDRPK